MILKELEAHHVQEHYELCIQSGLSDQTVLHIYHRFSQALKQAVTKQLIPFNGLDSINPPKYRRAAMYFLTTDEDRMLLDQAAETDYHLPIHLALYAGLRRSEVLGLQWQDKDLERGRMTVARVMVGLIGNPNYITTPKTESSLRTIPVSPDTRAPQRPLPNAQQRL